MAEPDTFAQLLEEIPTTGPFEMSKLLGRTLRLLAAQEASTPSADEAHGEYVLRRAVMDVRKTLASAPGEDVVEAAKRVVREREEWMGKHAAAIARSDEAILLYNTELESLMKAEAERDGWRSRCLAAESLPSKERELMLSMKRERDAAREEIANLSQRLDDLAHDYAASVRDSGAAREALAQKDTPFCLWRRKIIEMCGGCADPGHDDVESCVRGIVRERDALRAEVAALKAAVAAARAEAIDECAKACDKLVCRANETSWGRGAAASARRIRRLVAAPPSAGGGE